MSDAPDDDFRLSGTVIAERFSVDAPIAEGGFGLVYRGTHLGFDRPVAIKCLRVPRELRGARREDFLRRFGDEGRLLFELSSLHAGIVRAIETGTVRSPSHGDVPYLVLEWLEGESLERVMERRDERGRPPLSLPAIIEHLEPVASALAAAHDRGVVHRDIKPSNIVFANVMGKRTAKVLDFGIAKVMHEAWSVTSAKTSRAEGSVGMFTPAYAAPEQWVTRFGATGPWTDVFSFALVCVELLSGKPALEGPNIPQFLGQCIDETERPTPRTRGATVPDAVEDIFRRALDVEPKNRQADMRVLWDELCEAAATMSADASERLSLEVVRNMDTTIYGAPLSKRDALVPRVSTLRTPAKAGRIAVAVGLVMAIALVIALVLRPWEAEPEVIRARSGVKEQPPPPAAHDGEASLTVLCVPFCSDIQLEGQSLGPSPLFDRAVKPGRGTLVLYRDGTSPKRMSLSMRNMSVHEITVSMDP